jgi:MFS family permease
MNTAKESNSPAITQQTSGKWYEGVTRYQWLILLIASAGWVFDVYEGQIFNITRDQLLADILKVPTNHPSILDWGDKFLGIFLVGGTLGGIFFGSLADKWGRRLTMILTILVYSVFSGLTFFATELWHVAALRFLVAVGVGGEWAVAAALVAEVFPTRARAHASGIFHATSVLGTWLATVAGWLAASQWRYAYLVGVVPAVLVLWVRMSVKEPETWKDAGQKAAAQGAKMGSLRDLLGNPRWSKRAILGMFLAAVGLGSFWGVTVAGQGLAKAILIKDGIDPQQAMQKAKIAYGIIQTVGGGIGLLAFGPMCARFGRKKAFVFMHIMAFIIVPITCYAPQNYTQLVILLPIFGFLTLGMHAGYAIYFPELFPSHLRATGTGFCFNGGRILAASMLWLSAKLKASMDLHQAITILGCSFLLGLIVISFLPETKDQPLPE